MADGSTKPISEIEPGDEVWALDPETGEAGARGVTAVWPHQDTLLEFSVAGGSVTTTEDHHFWNRTDGEWQETQHIDAGDYLITAAGQVLEAGSLDWSTAHYADAYDLTIDDIHTYFVVTGDEQVLVHNCSDRAWDIAVKADQTPGRMAELGFDSVDSLATRLDEIVGSSRGILRDDGSLLYRDGDLFVSIPSSAATPGTIFRSTDQYWEDQLARSVYSGGWG